MYTNFCNLTTNQNLSADVVHLLTSLNQALTASKELRATLQHALSSEPAHPYEKLKQQYLGKNAEILSIDNIPEPENFCINTCNKQISALSMQYSNNFMSYYACNSATNSFDDKCAFMELSSTNEGEKFVVNQNRASGYFKFLETVKKIPVQLIDQHPEIVARKLLTYYIDCMK